jgi:hypothetical protein
MILLRKLFLFGAFIVLLTSCEERINIEDYYFPREKLEEKGMVYEYRSSGEVPMPTIYWYYYGTWENRDKFLNGIYMEADFIPRQYVKEEFIKTGILLDSINIAMPDSTNKISTVPGEVLVGNVFPYSVVEDGGIFLYKVKFEIPDSTRNTATLIKNRQYATDTIFNFNNVMYDCVKFDVKELVEYGNDAEGYTEPPFSGFELYAKSIGLVHYEKQTEDGPFMSYTLHKRYPLEEAHVFLREELLKLGIK